MAVEATPQVKVQVFGHTDREQGCKPSGWGPVRSSAETAQIVEFYVQLRHGSAVQVEYFDLSEPEAQAWYPDLFAQAEEQGLPYPLVTVNDQLALVGPAHYYEVLSLVEQALAS